MLGPLVPQRDAMVVTREELGRWLMSSATRRRCARTGKAAALALLGLATACLGCRSGGGVGTRRVPVQSAASARKSPGLQRVGPKQLRVTHGEIASRPNGRFAVQRPSTRAVLRHSGPSGAELRFRYNGPTEVARKLRGGQRRVQIALKLRAQDSCDLVYVTWRVRPVPGLVVVVKRNPGMHRHSQCTNAGYRTIRPGWSAPVRLLLPGASHRLRARLKQRHLAIHIDEKLVWRGDLGAEVLDLRGPVGIRTDNMRCDFELFAATGPAVVTP